MSVSKSLTSMLLSIVIVGAAQKIVGSVVNKIYGEKEEKSDL